MLPPGVSSLQASKLKILVFTNGPMFELPQYVARSPLAFEPTCLVPWVACSWSNGKIMVTEGHFCGIFGRSEHYRQCATALTEGNVGRRVCISRVTVLRDR